MIVVGKFQLKVKKYLQKTQKKIRLLTFFEILSSSYENFTYICDATKDKKIWIATITEEILSMHAF